MSHLAFRRDTSDDQLIVRFAVEVGSPDALQMLYLLTAADLAAVGPGVLNNWKAEVLTDLYRRTMRHLAGEGSALASDERAEASRGKIRGHLRGVDDLTWYDVVIASLPHDYLSSTPPQQVAAELRELHTLPKGEVFARGQFLPDRRTVEYTVGAHEDIAPGVFHKLTGALASQGLEILAAQINTLADGLILDRFVVHDPDYAEEPPRTRLEEISQALRRALSERDAPPPAFRRTWGARPPLTVAAMPARVRTDNSTSERYTIVDVFAADRIGLLYRVTRTLFELGLSVSLAKIATHLDQVVDVFYVTDMEGRKVEDEGRLEAIRSRLLEEIEAVERQEAERVG
jgi:[protein-PII] uridylyltransferase